MVLGFSKEERQERAADKAAKKIAKRKRRAGRRRGMIESAEKQGYEEGKEGRTHGILDSVAKVIGSAPKTESHYVGRGKKRHKVSRTTKGSGILSHVGVASSSDLGRDFGFGGNERKEGFGVDTKELERSLDFGGFGFGGSKKRREIRPGDLGL